LVGDGLGALVGDGSVFLVGDGLGVGAAVFAVVLIDEAGVEANVIGRSDSSPWISI
jgi:hypothetical protein